MSDYTDSSGFEKPVPGTQAGTWGGTVNTNMDLVDEAINGIATITLTAAGTTGAPNTMLITDGATSAARHAFIEVTDNAFGTNQDVYLQLTETGGTVLSERICWIKNNMSSGNDLYLFQGNYDAGRDYVVPQGKTALVRFTGGGSVTNCYVYNVIENAYLQGTLDLTGNLTAANVSGTNTGDNPGVTSVGTSGALTGGPITGTGTITHLNTDGYKHIPSAGSSGQFVKWAAAGSGTWASISTTDISGYQTPAMYDNAGTPTLQAGITQEEYRNAIGAGTSSTTGTVTSVSGGSGLTGSITTSGSLDVGAGAGIQVNADSVQLDYLGTNNFIRVATDLEGTAIAVTDTIIYSDSTDGNIKKGLISDLPGIGASGTVTSVASGNGMNFTEITGAGSVVLGTPSSISDTSTNSVTATSHTHAVSHTGTGNFAMADSPVFTGTPTAPTQAVGNNSTRLATTAFVNAEIANDAPLKDGTGATGTWGISITGSSASASTATSATNATNAVNVTGAAQTAITSVGTLTSLNVSGGIVGDTNIKLLERAAASTDSATYGQIWVKNSTPQELWFTNEDGTDTRLDVASGGTVTSVTGATGLTGTVTTSGNITVDYNGLDNIIMTASDLGGSLSTSDWILFSNSSDDNVYRGQVSDLPFTNNSGTMTSVTVNAGAGLTGGGTDSVGPSATIPDIVLGTPSSCTGSTTNSVTASSHTHAISDLDASDVTTGTFSTSRIPTSGYGAFQASSFTATSALRRKVIHSVFPTYRSDDLMNLEPVLYSLKDDDDAQVQLGFVADYVQTWFPEVVTHNEKGEVEGLDYSRLVVPIIAKLKEQEERILKLEEML